MFYKLQINFLLNRYQVALSNLIIQELNQKTMHQLLKTKIFIVFPNNQENLKIKLIDLLISIQIQEK
jgi:hypothetical protein